MAAVVLSFQVLMVRVSFFSISQNFNNQELYCRQCKWCYGGNRRIEDHKLGCEYRNWGNSCVRGCNG